MSAQVLDSHESCYVDIVLCIDATASMARYLDAVKGNARSLLRDYIRDTESKVGKLDQLRVKVIAFRDYAYDEEPMVESAFFTLPEQQDAFESCLDGIEAKGGRGGAENGLEAIALALKSDWTTEGAWRRHAVWVFSDMPPVPFNSGRPCPQYPEGMPKDLEQLRAWWEGSDPTFTGSFQPEAGCLAIFVPKVGPWVHLEKWERCTPVYSRAGTDADWSGKKAVLEQMRFPFRIKGDGNCVDLVLCIDATASMAPYLEEVKANVLSIWQKLVESMEEYEYEVEQLRVKVIAFRDYAYDKEPMVESKFFTLPEQQKEYTDFIDGIEAKGGGGGAENALEAIALALKSDWTTGGARRRHVVLVFTDAPALPLGARAGCPGYPSGMPKDLAQLGTWWEGIDPTFEGTFQPRNGRLIAFVPNAEPWVEMQAWNRYWPAFPEAGENLNLEEYQFSDVLITLLFGS